MGCFAACFGHWRHQETMKGAQDRCSSPSHEAVKLLPDTTESVKEDKIINPTKMVSESEGKCEEQMNESSGKKAIFDNSDVKRATNELNSSNSDNLMENENGKAEKERDKGKDDESDLTLLSRIPVSANHWRQDFLTSDKERVGAVNSKEISSDSCPVQEESSESLFSLSIDSRKHVFAAEMGEKEVSSPLKPSDRENNTKRIVHFLMKTEEKTSLKCDEEKENAPLSKDPIIKQPFDESKPTSDPQFKKRDSEIVVDTSLSSWLVESEKSPQKMSTENSPESEKNYVDRRILGAMVSPAELKELNVCSCAGSTPCCSADDQPGIGTVGRYWRQRGLAAGPVVEMGSGSCCRGVSPVWTKV